jgi:hypothetical protein
MDGHFFYRQQLTVNRHPSSVIRQPSTVIHYEHPD